LLEADALQKPPHKQGIKSSRTKPTRKPKLVLIPCLINLPTQRQTGNIQHNDCIRLLYVASQPSCPTLLVAGQALIAAFLLCAETVVGKTKYKSTQNCRKGHLAHLPSDYPSQRYIYIMGLIRAAARASPQSKAVI